MAAKYWLSWTSPSTPKVITRWDSGCKAYLFTLSYHQVLGRVRHWLRSSGEDSIQRRESILVNLTTFGFGVQFGSMAELIAL
jgi:hypothetical protein